MCVCVFVVWQEQWLVGAGFDLRVYHDRGDFLFLPLTSLFLYHLVCR